VIQYPHSMRCDLCGSEERKPFPRWVTGTQGVVICRGCGLMYTDPAPSRDEIQRMYDEVFTDDPGAPPLPPEDEETAEKRFQSAIRRTETRFIPLVAADGNLEGKRWLELRCRQGGVLAAVLARGGAATGIDLFSRNVEWARKRLPAARIHQATVDDLFAPVKGETFDVISMMTVHVPSHVPSPARLFQDAYDHLAPGGRLILDEKDVSQVNLRKGHFPFRYPEGMGHYHHVTVASVRSFVERAGLEIISSEYGRWSAARHFVLVARKPERPLAASAPKGEEPSRLYRRMVVQYGQHLVAKAAFGAIGRVVRFVRPRPAHASTN
jgi:SAM-dependent methyltransferase